MSSLGAYHQIPLAGEQNLNGAILPVRVDLCLNLCVTGGSPRFEVARGLCGIRVGICVSVTEARGVGG
jgi:hypothetical protein